ncbi:MAG: hypothetical protein E7521_06535 [Ruminococcaceae bacterium]|nr:hypothetical protein [Oscillospiraceae bacterium]
MVVGDVITLIIDSIKSAASTIKNSSRRAKQGMFACVAVIAILASLSFTGTRIAYKVDYSGSKIATVSSKKQFNDALDLVAQMVEGDDVANAVEEPKFSATVVLGDDINDTQEVANAIIDNTDEIVAATVIKVDDSIVARGEKETVDTIISTRLNIFNSDEGVCTSRFVKDVKCEDGYFIKSELDGERAIEGVVNSLDVVTEMRKTTDIIVPFKSTTQKTNEQIVGYSKVTVTGVSGVNRVTQDVIMVNGEIQSCVEVSNEVVVAPVNEVIVKGTAKTLASAKQKQQAHAAGFIFPLPSGTWRVSSYYGDGRNHKGVDICAKGGTSIYAVADGTVVHSGWKGDYGYCVIVEHEGGMRTLYAHAKQLCCNVGDTVSQGEVIALVGTTGQSTGNHLHFEVIVNGRNYDPAPYINLD